MATASAIIDVVRLRTDSTALSNTQALDQLNDAQREIQRRYPLNWQEAVAAVASASPTTGNFQTFTYPTDAKSIRAVYAIISGEHNLITYAEDFLETVDEMAGATSATSPIFWSDYGETGYFFPHLSTAISYQVFYDKLLPDLTITGANTLTTKFPEVLKDAATAEYYEALSEVDKAAAFWGKAERRMTRYLKQQRAAKDRQREPIPQTPGRLKRRKRTNYRGYTWW